MNIRDIVFAGTRSQELLYSVVNEHADLCTREIETVSAYKSIYQLLAHSIGAEARWIARLKNEAQPERYENRQITDLSVLKTDWRTQRNELMHLIMNYDDALPTTIFEIKLAQWNYETTMNGEEIVYHVINHECYHRGQCSYMLQMFGVDPPNFDYVFTKSRQ